MSLAFSLPAGSATTQGDRPKGPTAAANSEHFVSLAALVLVMKDATSSAFGITLGTMKPLPENTSVHIEFENPSNPEMPFEVEASLDARDHLVVQSPQVDGIYNQRSYLVRLRILGAEKRLVSVHEQWIWFDMPAQMRSVYATIVGTESWHRLEAVSH